MVKHCMHFHILILAFPFRRNWTKYIFNQELVGRLLSHISGHPSFTKCTEGGGSSSLPCSQEGLGDSEAQDSGPGQRAVMLSFLLQMCPLLEIFNCKQDERKMHCTGSKCHSPSSRFCSPVLCYEATILHQKWFLSQRRLFSLS